MRQVWTAVLGVLSVLAIGCVAVVGAELLRGCSGNHLTEGYEFGGAPSGVDKALTMGQPAQTQEGEGALDLVLPEWMVRQGESVQVRFPGGWTHPLPFFTRVQPGVYMLEFSGPSYRPVLCQVRVSLRGRARVTFGGQSCRVEQND